MDDISNFVWGFYKVAKNLVGSKTDEQNDANNENSNTGKKNSIIYGKISNNKFYK